VASEPERQRGGKRNPSLALRLGPAKETHIMIRFWMRELMGWLLVLLGLAIFYICFAILINPDPSIFEAPILSVIGIVVFRGGIHLLKVAVAARMAMQTNTDARQPASVEKPTKKAETPWDW
jgi:hypothetical protein